MRWSKEQLEAINTTNQNITVSASAGSGKTTVLVHRLLKRIIEDEIPVDNVLAMTFTTAAAEEMKKRLSKELQNAVDKEENDTKKQYLRKQLSLLPTAEISTIDSFCLGILKDYYYVLSENPDRFQNIFDNNTYELYQKQALDMVVNKQLENDDETFLELILALGSNNENFSNVKKAIELIAKESLKRNKPFEWLDKTLSFYQSAECLDNLPAELLFYFWQKHISLVDNMAIQLNQIKDIVVEYDVSNELDYYLQHMDVYLSQAKQNINDKDYFALINNYLLLGSLALPAAKKALGSTSEEYMGARKVINGLVDTAIKNYAESEKSILSKLNYQKPLIECLIQCTKDFLVFFKEIKEQAKGIDYVDMELLAIEILQRNDHEVGKILQNKYEEIMIDEFQDSNDIQETLIQEICRTNNVFRVGDIKQSIYGFRNAKPELMRKYINNPDELNKVIFLANNYRSKKNIVDFNNLVFEKLMNLNNYSSNFSKEDIAQIGIDAQIHNDANIDLDILVTKGIKEGFNDYSNSQIQARYIAQKIINLKNSFQHKQWKDYVVLVRSHDRKSELKKAFEDYGIPYQFSTTTGFFSDFAVTTIISWLKLLLNRNDNTALFTILNSPYYNYDDNALAKLKLEKAELSFWEYLISIDEQIIHDYQVLKNLVYTSSPADIITALFQMQDFYSYSTTENQRNNLDSLFEMALNCTANGYCFSQFVDYILLNQQSDMGDAISLNETANVVKVSTIHGSKGLEFPVVIYWAAGIKKSPKENIRTDEILGISLDYVSLPKRFTYSTIVKDAITTKKVRDGIEEELRILYVTLTRARDKLVIVDNVATTPTYTNNFSTTYVENNPKVSSILATLFKSFPSDIFNPRIIDEAWIETPVDEITRQQRLLTLPKYKGPSTITTTASPSLLKGIKVYPLVLNSENKATRGNRMHKAMELLSFENYKKDDLDKLPLELSVSEKERIDSFFSHPMYDTIKAMKIEREFPFIIKQDSNYLNGRMDLVAFGSNRIVLVDFKSDQNVTKEELIDRYSSQMQSYNQALNIGYENYDISCFIYSFELCEWIEINV